TDEWGVEGPFVDVVGFVRWGQHFGFVDEVDLECFENLCFDEMSDANFGHDRNRADLLDLFDHLRIRHARDTAVTTNVRRYAFQRHHGDRTRVLGDTRLLRVDHVHDHATTEMIGVTTLHEGTTGW